MDGLHLSTLETTKYCLAACSGDGEDRLADVGDSPAAEEHIAAEGDSEPVVAKDLGAAEHLEEGSPRGWPQNDILCHHTL